MKRFIAELPGITSLRRLRYERKVQRGSDWTFWGVFTDYQDAIARAPRNPVLKVGYDTPGVVDRGRDHYETMHGFDYAALFWLHRFTASSNEQANDSCRVVDLGGHLGAKYKVYRCRWSPPPGLSWIVCETTAMVEAAGRMPDADRPEGLSFTTDSGVVDGAQVLFASGVLAYLKYNLWDLLDRCAAPPPHLVLNKVPLSRGPDVWTLQNASGYTMVPYHVFNRSRFLDALTSRGYRLLDEWSVPERAVHIPFEPGVGTENGSGLSLTRASESAFPVGRAR